jgi:mycothiol synthase
MRLRRLFAEDRDAVLETWNAGAVHDRLTPALLDEKVWNEDDFDPGLALAATDDGELVGFAVGVLRRTGVGYVKLLAVEQRHWRAGIASALLAAVEERLASRGARSIRLLESAPNYLTPGIDCRYREAIAFAQACGYEKTGEAQNLAVDLAGELPDPVAASDAEIRRAAASDGPALCDFLDAHWPTWNAEAGIALANTPPTLHLALRDGRVTGFAAWDANNRGTGWFGPMGVAPGERRGGIGCVLLHRCLDDMRRQGHDAAVIAWVDNAPFYVRCAGAVPARTFVRFEKTLHAD